MRCYRCGAPFGGERVGVRDGCERCAAYLHCCRNCTFYEPGLANDCREPNAERVADKELGNFCDHFRPPAATAAPPGKPTGSARADLEALFRKKPPRP